jgi:molecular chaperone IbpA|tara:strand:- start:732 stop:1127 length:396 start_codon:yes stop_codon:yes gene_type:complete
MNELDILRNHFLGFQNDFFDNFRRVSTYPPYNIKEKDDKGVIEFAVAGFAEKDLKVEVKENTLSVSGCKEKELQEDLMHKGISDRSFIKRFQLHKQIVINNAELKDGLLKVSYHREIPEAEKPKQIKIKSN